MKGVKKMRNDTDIEYEVNLLVEEVCFKYDVESDFIGDIYPDYVRECMVRMRHCDAADYRYYMDEIRKELEREAIACK